jgi:hypothetical protein
MEIFKWQLKITADKAAAEPCLGKEGGDVEIQGLEDETLQLQIALDEAVQLVS